MKKNNDVGGGGATPVAPFEEIKEKAIKYISYKKRTEQEVRQKLEQIVVGAPAHRCPGGCGQPPLDVSVQSDVIDDVIEYLKESGYIDDSNYIERTVNEFIRLNNLSIKEIRYKLMQKGISRADIEEYIDKHEDEMIKYEKESAEKIFIKKQRILDKGEILKYLLQKGYKEEIIKDVGK